METNPRVSLCCNEREVGQFNHSDRVGVVLLQENDEKWQPIAYDSRTMSDTEKQYAQIEKEVLALTWAAEKFAMYVSPGQIVLYGNRP